jgi:hypothetical protein
MSSMSIATATLGLGLLLTPLAAHAVLVTGDFAGTLASGTDTSGVFETAGSDLTGQDIFGTFTYDTSLLGAPVGETYPGTGLGAITGTVTINGVTHTFIDQYSSSLYLDTTASEITVQNAQTQPGIAETFYLDASDPFSPFVTTTDPTQQNFVAPTSDIFFGSTGSFSISDTDATASGAFSLTSLSVSEVPEPATLTLMFGGLAGLFAVRKRARPPVRTLLSLKIQFARTHA